MTRQSKTSLLLEFSRPFTLVAPALGFASGSATAAGAAPREYWVRMTDGFAKREVHVVLGDREFPTMQPDLSQAGVEIDEDGATETPNDRFGKIVAEIDEEVGLGGGSQVARDHRAVRRDHDKPVGEIPGAEPPRQLGNICVDAFLRRTRGD